VRRALSHLWVSITTSVKWHGINPWSYLKHVLTELPTRPAGADSAGHLPGAGGALEGRADVTPPGGVPRGAAGGGYLDRA
jgi:hypothetical protein